MQKGLKKYFWLFALPTLVAFGIAFLVPFIMGIYLSFTKFTTVTNATFIGLDNYKKVFYEKNYFDYSLIMQEMLYQLENNQEFAKTVTNQIKYLTVDEYQDTNGVQYEFVRLLAEK